MVSCSSRSESALESMLEELWEIGTTAEPGTMRYRIAKRALQEGENERNEILAYLEHRFRHDPSVLAELEAVKRGAHKR